MIKVYISESALGSREMVRSLPGPLLNCTKIIKRRRPFWFANGKPLRLPRCTLATRGKFDWNDIYLS